MVPQLLEGEWHPAGFCNIKLLFILSEGWPDTSHYHIPILTLAVQSAVMHL